MNNNEDNLKNLKELIDSFNSNYYKEENEKIMNRIINIEFNRPEYQGIYKDYEGQIVPENKKQQRIKELRDRIKYNEEKIDKLNSVLNQLRDSANELEKIAEQQVLIDLLEKYLIFVDEKFNETKRNIHPEKNEIEYKKLVSNSRNQNIKPKDKISKEMYKLIKKNLGKMVYEDNKIYKTMEESLKDNNIWYGNSAYKIINDFEMNYYDENDKAKLHVSVNTLKNAREKILEDFNPNELTEQAKESLSDKDKDIVEKLENINRALSVNIKTIIGTKKLEELKNKYIEILKLSRETWYVDQILFAFAVTSINNSEVYNGLRELVNEQKKELEESTKLYDELYQKTGMLYKEHLVKKLYELNEEIQNLKFEIDHLKEQKDYKQIDLKEQEYRELRYEMLKIMKDNPELNNFKNDFNVEKLIKQEMESLEKEIIRFTEENRVFNVKVEENLAVEKQNIEEPVVEKTSEEESLNGEVEEAVVEKIDNLEIDFNLQMIRTSQYQNYMREKVLNSDLGKLSFSSYLETVAPYLTELINVEKQRERLARTIYKDYIKYYISLDDKKTAIEFEAFARNNYGISNVDVPIEHEEEYKGMIK